MTPFFQGLLFYLGCRDSSIVPCTSGDLFFTLCGFLLPERPDAQDRLLAWPPGVAVNLPIWAQWARVCPAEPLPTGTMPSWLPLWSEGRCPLSSCIEILPPVQGTRALGFQGATAVGNEPQVAARPSTLRGHHQKVPW